MVIKLPEDIKEFINHHFSKCNNLLSNDLSRFPAIYEDTLDMSFVTYFARLIGPIKFESNWILTIESHFIGGGRHYRTWEVADIALVFIFKNKGRVVYSKIALLQSKKLYAVPLKYFEYNPYVMGSGLGRVITPSVNEKIIEEKTYTFSENCNYKAFQKESQQQITMAEFEKRFNMKLYYLFYNPCIIPLTVESPVSNSIEKKYENNVGMRIIPKPEVDVMLSSKRKKYSPSYADLKYQLTGQFLSNEHTTGWRFEFFVNDLMLKCKEGLLDDSPNFKDIQAITNQKRMAMASSISFTFNINE